MVLAVREPDRPSRKYVTACWCGRETEKISTPLRGPPWPVTDDKQMRSPRRPWQRS